MALLSTRRRRCFAGLLALLLLSTLAGLVWIDRWQREKIFSIELGEQRWWREAPPGTEVFDIALPGGESLRAWYIGQPRADAPAVLYLHGARWNLHGTVFRMERWHELGYSILAIDYRGFGASSPRLPSQASATADAQAALAELARRQPDPSLRFVYGHSLGGAVAAQLATQQDAPPFAGLILESTFTNVRDMIGTTRWGEIPGLGLLVTQPFDSTAALARLHVPLLVLHGTADRVVPVDMSDALVNAAGGAGGLRRLAQFEGASHSGASRSAGYAEAVQQFVRDARAAYAGKPASRARG